MKKLVNTWGNSNQCAMVKTFAEAVLELTDKFSFESYRHKSLSLSAKARELGANLSEVSKKVVSKPALEPMIDEFNSSVSADRVVSRITFEQKIPPSAIDIRKTDTLESIQAALGIFSRLITPKYQKTAEKMILELCAGEAREKSAVKDCANLYVTHLLGNGSSREHVHLSAIRAFSIAEIDADPLEQVSSFFAEATPRQRNFEILIRCNKKTSEYWSNTLGSPCFDKAAELPKYFQYCLPDSMKNGKSSYVILPEVFGLDPFSAAKSAKIISEILNSFLVVFPDGNKRNQIQFVHVHDAETGGVYRVSLKDFINEGHPTRNKSDHQKLVEKMMNFTFAGGRRKDPGLQSKLFGALQAASAASNTVEVDARLLSVWSALEAILPSPMKDGEKSVHITHFAKYVAPLATSQYIYETYKSFYNDLSRNYMSTFYTFIDKNGEGDGKFEKFISIFHAEPEIKHEFTSIFRDSELLLERAGELDRVANSTSALRSKIEKHEQRVSWQIYRIYRTRNNIVHKASSDISTPYLTENAYSYFKALISILVTTCEKYDILEINPLFDLCMALCNEHKSRLGDFNETQSREALSFAVAGALA